MFLKKKSVISHIFQGGDGIHSVFLLFSTISTDHRLRVSDAYTSFSTLNAVSVHSSLMWQYKLQHTNSWSPSWEASWMRKEKQAEWGITLSCCLEHLVQEQSSKLLGGSRDPHCKWALQLCCGGCTFSGLSLRVILRIRKQAKGLQLKKMGTYSRIYELLPE